MSEPTDEEREYYSDAALEKQRQYDEYKARGEKPPLSLMFGYMERRVPPTEEDKCVCCGVDARSDGIPGGEDIDGERYCQICIGREHHK